MRLLAVKSKQCSSLTNKYYCPEVFLDVVATKLTQTAVLFLNVELLAEFKHSFPRELDMRLGRHLSDEEIERFAKEDPKIRGHLEVIRRKELLELVLSKMEGLRDLDKGLRGQSSGSMAKESKRRGAGREREKGWSLFRD